VFGTAANESKSFVNKKEMNMAFLTPTNLIDSTAVLELGSHD